VNLGDMRRLLGDRGIQLTRSLGQNFLHDSNQLRRIVELAEVQPGDQVLEIGPGLGPLTEALLAAGARVLAIEKDARLVAILRERLAAALVSEGNQAGPLTLQHADALDVVRQRRDWDGWKLVANLPYAVASPILVELAMAERPPSRLVATLQWEVAQRLMATSADEDYGILSLLVQLRYVPGSLLPVPAGCFFPVPDVESGCLRMDRRDGELLPAGQRPVFARLVKRAFSQRRKMMLKLLRQDWADAALQAAFAEAGLPTDIRAERVGLEQFVRLTSSLAATSPR
jgi:16S rRNA (adenine1518-N6/adenine1519-N6)-dimethyltransferase